MVPRPSLGRVDTVRSSELGFKSALQFAGAPQAQRLVDDRAAVQVGVSRDIGVDAGQQIWIEGGGDFGAATGVGRGGHGQSIEDISPDTLSVTQPGETRV